MLVWISLAALFLGARVLTARALKIRPWLLPREGAWWARALVALSGPLACLLVLVLFAFTVGLLAGVPRPAAPAVVSVHPDSPAARAGLAPGDRILAIQGHAVQTVADVLGQVQATAGLPFSLETERAGARRDVTAQAQFEGTRYRLGVQLDGSVRFERGGPVPAAKEAVQFPVHLTGLMLHSFRETLTGRPAVEMVGPAGVLRMAQASPSRAHLALHIVGPLLLLVAALGFVLSVILLLAARPRR